MKKKLKVKKAFRGKLMKAAVAQGKKAINSLPVNTSPRPPGAPLGSGGGPIPIGVTGPIGPGGPSRDPNFFSTTPPRPGMQQQGIQIINGVKQLPTVGPQPGTPLPPMQPSSQIDPSSPRSLPFASGVGPRDPNMFSTTPPRPGVQPSSQIDPNSPRSLPFASAVGPMQGVGDPRLGAPIIPGNQLQMQMRGPTQAMKKGGAVRGGRAEIKGLRPAKIT